MTVKLNVVDRAGNKTVIDVEEGVTIRDAIEENLDPDSYGVCGGNCSCGTCHVYVNSSDYDKIKPMEKDEIDTLQSSAIDTTQYSRLACQIELNKEYDNISVTIAPE